VNGSGVAALSLADIARRGNQNQTFEDRFMTLNQHNFGSKQNQSSRVTIATTSISFLNSSRTSIIYCYASPGTSDLAALVGLSHLTTGRQLPISSRGRPKQKHRKKRQEQGKERGSSIGTPHQTGHLFENARSIPHNGPRLDPTDRR